jgi:hypothetical protein
MGIFDFLTDSDEKALEALNKNTTDWERLKTPDLAWKDIVPDKYMSVGDLNTENAQYDLVDEDPARLAMQDQALMKLAGLADTGLSEVDELGFERAQSDAAQAARGNREATISEMRSRGLGGSGLDYAMREMGNQDAAERARRSAMEQAASSAENRALYQKAYMDSIGGVRDQDYRTEAGNSDVISRFNAANTQTRNAAAERNLNNRQDLSNQNVTAGNAAKATNQEGRNATAQQGFQNNLTRQQGVSGARGAQSQGYAADAASMSDGIGGIVGGAAKLGLGAMTGGGSLAAEGAAQAASSAPTVSPYKPKLSMDDDMYEIGRKLNG